jgi:hypothetical protein
MKCLLREGSAQLCKHQAIRASWVAQLVETVGRGCKDGLHLLRWSRRWDTPASIGGSVPHKSA